MAGGNGVVAGGNGVAAVLTVRLSRQCFLPGLPFSPASLMDTARGPLPTLLYADVEAWHLAPGLQAHQMTVQPDWHELRPELEPPADDVVGGHGQLGHIMLQHLAT